MKKNKTKKDIIFILASSFILTVIWIGFNIYHAWVTSTISEDQQMQIIPIAPNFDTKTLQKLKAREKVEPAQGIKSAAEPSSSPSVVESPPLQVSGSISITPTPIQSGPIAQPTPSIQPTGNPGI